MKEEMSVVKCAECGAANRVRIAESGKAAVCGRCGAKLPSAQARPVVATDANFAQLAAGAKLMLLDLWAPWCGPCRILSPIIDQIAAEMGGKVLVAKLNVDENPQTASRFQVQGIPTLLILKNGREADRIVGVESRESILRRLNSQI